jgi:hypothetical protein
MNLDRITIKPDLCGDAPMIRGMRITVSHVLEMLAGGMTPEEIFLTWRKQTSVPLWNTLLVSWYIARSRLASELLVDANLPPRLCLWLRSRQHQAEHLLERNLLTATRQRDLGDLASCSSYYLQQGHRFLRSRCCMVLRRKSSTLDWATVAMPDSLIFLPPPGMT